MSGVDRAATLSRMQDDQERHRTVAFRRTFSGESSRHPTCILHLPMHELDPWLDRLSAALPIARAGVDPEGVHQVRVALARLRVWLQLAKMKDEEKELRYFRDAAARVRDLDVHLARDLPEALEAELRDERTAAHRDLVLELDDPRLSRTFARLRELPPLDREAAQRGIAKKARIALARGRCVKRHPKSSDRLHALRCSIRRVRFALDWIGTSPPELIELQESLGAIADLRAAIAHVERAPKARALRVYRKQLEEQMVGARKEAHRRWRAAKPLLKTIASGAELTSS